MRLAAMICALAIVMCVAVFGAILSQRSSESAGSASPSPTAPADGSVRAVVTTVEEQNTPLVETTGLKVGCNAECSHRPGAGLVCVCSGDSVHCDLRASAGSHTPGQRHVILPG